jgi:hypothetical protein
MACWSTSDTRRPMRMTPRGRCVRGWGWSKRRRVEVQCSTAKPRGHCHRVGRSRRSDWDGLTQEQAVIGETPNLAAQLRGIAEPNATAKAHWIGHQAALRPMSEPINGWRYAGSR